MYYNKSFVMPCNIRLAAVSLKLFDKNDIFGLSNNMTEVALRNNIIITLSAIFR